MNDRATFLLQAAFTARTTSPPLSRHYIHEFLQNLLDNDIQLSSQWQQRFCMNCGNIFGCNSSFSVLSRRELKATIPTLNYRRMENGKCINFMVITCECCNEKYVWNGERVDNQQNIQKSAAPQIAATASLSASLQQPKKISSLSKPNVKAINKILKRSNEKSTLNLAQFLKKG